MSGSRLFLRFGKLEITARRRMSRGDAMHVLNSRLQIRPESESYVRGMSKRRRSIQERQKARRDATRGHGGADSARFALIFPRPACSLHGPCRLVCFIKHTATRYAVLPPGSLFSYSSYMPKQSHVNNEDDLHFLSFKIILVTVTFEILQEVNSNY